MKAREIRGLSMQELREKLDALNRQLMDLDFKRKTGAEKPHLFKEARRARARVLTILKEKSKQ